MANETRLRLVLTLAAEKAAAGLKRLGQGSTASAQALRKTQGALRDLQAQAKALREFESNRNILDGARQQLDMAKKVGLTGTAMKRLTADYEKQLAVVKRLNGAMYDKGWGNLGTTQEKLAADIAATNARLEAQRKHLERLAKLRTSTQAMAIKGAAITGAGYGAQFAGRTMAHGAATVLDEGKNYARQALQIQSLNLGDKATKDAIQYAKAMQTYGTSTVDNLGLMKDALTAFADTHHAFPIEFSRNAAHATRRLDLGRGYARARRHTGGLGAVQQHLVAGRVQVAAGADQGDGGFGALVRVGHALGPQVDDVAAAREAAAVDVGGGVAGRSDHELDRCARRNCHRAPLAISPHRFA